MASQDKKRKVQTSENSETEHEEMEVLNAAPANEPCILSDLPPDTIMCLRTLQSSQWRTLSDSLKDVLPQSSVTFNKEGMKLVALESCHIALIHLQVTSEFYYLRDDEVTVGLNLTSLYRSVLYIHACLVTIH